MMSLEEFKNLKEGDFIILTYTPYSENLDVNTIILMLETDYHNGSTESNCSISVNVVMDNDPGEDRWQEGTLMTLLLSESKRITKI